MDTLTEDLLKEIECPVCLELMVPPITQCDNGHNICSACRPRLQNCPTCRATFTNVRNLTAENLSRKMKKHPCRFRSSGCLEEFLQDELEGHEEDCRFQPMACVCESSLDCPWKGPVKEAVAHMLKHHDYDFFEAAGETSAPLLRYSEGGKFGDGWYRSLISSNTLFLLCSRVMDDIFYTCCYIHPPKDIADSCSFKYRMSLSSAGCGSKFVYEHDIPVLEQVDKFPAGSHVAMLHNKFVRTFVDAAEDKLTILFEITCVNKTEPR